MDKTKPYAPKKVKFVVPEHSGSHPILNKNASQFQQTTKPKQNEVTGDARTFFEPLVPRHLGALENVRIFVSDKQLEFFNNIQETKENLGSTTKPHELEEIYDKLIEQINQNYTLLSLTSGLFDELLVKFDTSANKGIQYQSDEEHKLFVKEFEVLKIFLKPPQHRKKFIEMGLGQSLQKFMNRNEIKSSSDNEKKVKLITLSMYLLTNFSMIENEEVETIVGALFDQVWSYFCMNIENLQYQSMAFMWSLSYNSEFFDQIQERVKFLINKFNEFRMGWSNKTIEIFFCFLSNLLFSGKDYDFEELSKQEEKDILEFREFIINQKAYMTDKAKYFMDKIFYVLPEVESEEENQEQN